MVKHTRGSMIAGTVAVLLVAAGIFLLVTANVMRLAFLGSINARPVDIAVDVSQEGVYTAPFHQTYDIAHGESLCLVVPEEFLEGGSPETLFSALRFESSIKDARGHAVVETEFDGQLPWGERLFDGAVPLVRFRPFAKGQYTLEFRVTRGVPELAGIPVHLIARYELCGMELMLAFLVLIGGVIAFIIAMIILLTVWVFRRRRQTRELP